MSGSIATRSGDAWLRRHSPGQSGSRPARQVPWGKGEGWVSRSPQSQMSASSSLHTTSLTFSWTAFESDESSPSLCLTPAQSLHLLTLLHQLLLDYTNLLPWLLLLFAPLPPNNPPSTPATERSFYNKGLCHRSAQNPALAPWHLGRKHESFRLVFTTLHHLVFALFPNSTVVKSQDSDTRLCSPSRGQAVFHVFPCAGPSTWKASSPTTYSSFKIQSTSLPLGKPSVTSAPHSQFVTSEHLIYCLLVLPSISFFLFLSALLRYNQQINIVYI